MDTDLELLAIKCLELQVAARKHLLAMSLVAAVPADTNGIHWVSADKLAVIYNTIR